MKIVIIVLSITVIILFLLLVGIKKSRDEVGEKYTRLEESVGALQQTIYALQRNDIQRLIEYVKQVMSGELHIEDETDPLMRYSYREDLYPAKQVIEVDLYIAEIYLDSNICEMKVSYCISYLDSLGRTIYGSIASPALPARWLLEWIESEWVFVDIEESP